MSDFHYIIDPDVVPPENFKWFYETGGDASNTAINFTSLTVEAPDGSKTVRDYTTGEFDPKDPLKAQTWVSYTDGDGVEHRLRTELVLNHGHKNHPSKKVHSMEMNGVGGSHNLSLQKQAPPIGEKRKVGLTATTLFPEDEGKQVEQSQARYQNYEQILNKMVTGMALLPPVKRMHTAYKAQRDQSGTGNEDETALAAQQPGQAFDTSILEEFQRGVDVKA